MLGAKMRGNLPEERLMEIDSKLPTLDSRFRLATTQGPGVDINDLVKGTDLGVALVCLGDAGDRFRQVRLAVREALACLIWYREVSPKAPIETSAVFLGGFYLDYATLLLYAAGEDIAAFVKAFLGIEAELKDYLRLPEIQKELSDKRISSEAARVGIFMKRKYPDHEITAITSELHRNSDWHRAIEYRNDWVHGKPPIIEGLGIQYDRKSRVVRNEGVGMEISFGGGSAPDHTIDELLNMTLLASEALAKALSSLVGILARKREELGEKFDFDRGEVESSSILKQLILHE